MTWSNFNTKDPEILGATVQDLVTWATWRLGFVSSCLNVWDLFIYRFIYLWVLTMLLIARMPWFGIQIVIYVKTRNETFQNEHTRRPFIQ
jgi:hypothetical protein